jgi:hypothetical protein
MNAPEIQPVDYFSLAHPFRRIASAISCRARRQMFLRFMELIGPNQDSTILDVGVTPDQALPESNFFEQLYPYKEKITATSYEDASFLETKFPGLHFVRTVGQKLPFNDLAFDIVVSLAVLEHVGDRAMQQAFLSELFRVGHRVFVTTPNRGFPIELHTFLPFIHWLPRSRHQALLRFLGFHFLAKTENLNLVDSRELPSLLPVDCGARIHRHKLLGLTSNLIVVR